MSAPDGRQQGCASTVSKQFRQFERGLKGFFMTRTGNVVKGDTVDTTPIIDTPEDLQRPEGTSV